MNTYNKRAIEKKWQEYWEREGLFKTSDKPKKKYYNLVMFAYPSGDIHMGHCKNYVIGDVIARYKRARGYDVAFLTGTDEHGQKVEMAAKANGETPLELADRVVKRFQALWTKLNVSHTDFIRTTQERHKHTVQEQFKAIEAKGDIYLGEYEDWYCTPCETCLLYTSDAADE